jgi:hypothetical protein
MGTGGHPWRNKRRLRCLARPYGARSTPDTGRMKRPPKQMAAYQGPSPQEQAGTHLIRRRNYGN